MLTFLLALTATAADHDATAVVRRWIEAGAQDDFAQVRSLVEERCHDRPVGRAAAVHVLGVPLVLSSVDVGEPEIEGAKARVGYAIRGSLPSRSVTTTNNILGQQVTLQVDGLTLDELDITATVDLVHGASGWKITCSADGPPTQAPVPDPAAPPTAHP